MNGCVELLCEDLPEANREYVLTILPRIRTKVLEATVSQNEFSLRLFTDCRTEMEARAWIKEFEQGTKTTYTVNKTPFNTGRFLEFKQYLYCQHNTRLKESCDLTKKGNKRAKNTNCPSKMIVTLHAIKSKYRGKDKEKYLMRKDLPCEVFINLAHNHSTEGPEVLRFRKVGNEVREKLIQLFESGHSPATALEAVKSEICLVHENPDAILADRYHFPDYMYCYHLYIKVFAQKSGAPLVKGLRRKSIKPKKTNSHETSQDISVETFTGHQIITLPDLLDFSLENNSTEETTAKIIFLEEPESATNDSSENLGDAVILQDEYLIVEEEVELSTSTEDKPESSQESMERAVSTIEKLQELFLGFVQESPLEAADGLQIMLENVKRLSSAEEFAEACSNFGVKKLSNLPEQPVADCKRSVELMLPVSHSINQSPVKKRLKTDSDLLQILSE